MLAEDMKRLGDGEPVKLDLADRVRHRIDLLRQRIVELEASASTSAELAAAERAVVSEAINVIDNGARGITNLEDAVDALLALRAALGFGEQKGKSDGYG